MKLDCVLTACNNNPMYYNFIPIFIRAWNKLYPSVDVKIVYIDTNLPDFLQEYKDNIILFEPIKNVSDAFISQYIRLLYPAILNYENGILITDIDILPMNRTYYTKNIESFPNNKFIYLRDALLKDENQIAMCYNVATNKTWEEIFDIHSVEDINKRLIQVNSRVTYINGSGNSAWFTDQLDLYSHVMEWNKKTNNFVSLPDNTTEFNRLDRINNINLADINVRNSITEGKYTDYHCFTPYGQYKLITDTIVFLL
jgi:hypothetical protein